MKKNKFTRSLLCLSLAILLLFSAVSCNTNPPKPSETTDGDTSEEVSTTEEVTTEEVTTEEVTTEAVVLSPKELAAQIEPGTRIKQIKKLLGFSGVEVLKSYSTTEREWYKWEFETGETLLVYAKTTGSVIHVCFSENTPNPDGLPTVSEAIEFLEASDTYGDLVEKFGYHGTQYISDSLKNGSYFSDYFEWRCSNGRVFVSIDAPSQKHTSFYDLRIKKHTSELPLLTAYGQVPIISADKISELSVGMTIDEVTKVLGTDQLCVYHYNTYEWSIENGDRLFLFFQKNDLGELILQTVKVLPDVKETELKFITKEQADLLFKGITIEEIEELVDDDTVVLQWGALSTCVLSFYVDGPDGEIIAYRSVSMSDLYTFRKESSLCFSPSDNTTTAAP